MLLLFQRLYYNVFYGNFCQVDNIWNIFFQIIPVEIQICHFPQIKLVDYLYVVGDHFLGEVEQAGNLVTVFTGNTVNVFVDQKDFVIQLIQILAEALEFGYLIVFTCAQNRIELFSPGIFRQRTLQLSGISGVDAVGTKDFFQLLKQVGIYGGHVAGQRLYLDYFVFVLISFYVLVCQKGFAAAPGAVYANCIYLR